MCFGGGKGADPPYNPAPYALEDSYQAVDYEAQDDKTGQVVNSKQGSANNPYGQSTASTSTTQQSTGTTINFSDDYTKGP